MTCVKKKERIYVFIRQEISNNQSNTNYKCCVRLFKVEGIFVKTGILGVGEGIALYLK